jgi:tyrosine-protein kinase Etk/Wzc
MDNIVSVSKDKDGLITVAAETKSATLSAEIAESYLGFLRRFSKGPAKEKREFVESQLAKAGAELVQAEQAFKEFQDQNRLVSIDQQSKAIIDRLVQLEGSRLESDIALKMQQSLLKSSGNLPELVKLEGQKVSEEAKQKALAQAIAEAEKALETLPTLGLSYARMRRDLMVKEKIFGMLTEQFEMAKIAEAEEGSQFEIIDRARIPDRKSKPKRSLIVILAGITAGMLGVFLAFFLEFLEKRRRDEAKRAAGAGENRPAAGA